MPKKKPKVSNTKILTAGLIISLLVNGAFLFSKLNSTSNKTQSEYYNIEQVYDGDTIKLEGNFDTRLGGVDAPEKGSCYAEQSKDFLTNLVNGKTVKVISVGKDQYNRSIVYVYADDIFVNNELLKNGMAIYDPRASGPQKNDLLATANMAKENKVGLFGEVCTSTIPPSPNCNIKGNIHRDTKEKSYHLPKCRHYNVTTVQKYRGEDWFCSEQEAINAGYKKSTTCP
jgi:micrococcal nuclease